MITYCKEKFYSLFSTFEVRCLYPTSSEIETIYSKIDFAQRVANLKSKNVINVGFFCMSIAMWKYEMLFDLMKLDKRFNPIFFISPRMGSWKVRKKEILEMQNYCAQKGYQCVNLKYDFFNQGQDVSKYSLDIAFYTQPYEYTTCRQYYYDKLSSALLCYVPYGYLITDKEHNFVSLLNKIAWKNYYPTPNSVKVAYEYNRGKGNFVFLGYPGYDMYNDAPNATWKSVSKKRIIWAPHASINENDWLNVSSFMLVYDFMKDLSVKYKDHIEVAFKPHPHLYGKLCDRWGAEKTNTYYNWWKNNDNTILYEGNPYPLFKSSDALIHDSCSFMLDYMYANKPCLYITQTGELAIKTIEDGKVAFAAHYIATDKCEIESFICNIINNNKDEKEHDRANVLKKYLTYDNGLSASQNIINDIISSIK